MFLTFQFPQLYCFVMSNEHIVPFNVIKSKPVEDQTFIQTNHNLIY